MASSNRPILQYSQENQHHSGEQGAAVERSTTFSGEIMRIERDLTQGKNNKTFDDHEALNAEGSSPMLQLLRPGDQQTLNIKSGQNSPIFSSRSNDKSLTSLLAADSESEEIDIEINNDDVQSRQSRAGAPETKDKSMEKKQHTSHHRPTLTKLQEEISYAVETNNVYYFVDLGGVFYYDINFTGRSGFPLKIAATKGHEKFMRLLLENKKIEINKQDEDGLNSFWIAARCGHGAVLKVLAEHGIDIYNCDRHGNNALHMSAKYKDRFRICELLVNSGYELNLKNEFGNTATHIAAQKGNIEHLETMLDAGADYNELNNHALSPMYLAILGQHTECVHALLEAGAKAFFGGSDVEKDRSPVYLAIRTQQVEVLKAIFAYIEPEAQSTISNSKGQTPVMFAAKNGYHEALNALIELNSTSINQEDKEQRTILMHVLSAEPFDRKLANRLVDQWEADVNHIDIYGRSLLIKLVQQKKKNLVEFLLTKGALMHVLDEDQKDACDYAKDNGLALELREFLNCSIRKKRADMQKLTVKQAERTAQLEVSFKAASQVSAKRRASIAIQSAGRRNSSVMHQRDSAALTAAFGGVNQSRTDLHIETRSQGDSLASHDAQRRDSFARQSITIETDKQSNCNFQQQNAGQRTDDLADFSQLLIEENQKSLSVVPHLSALKPKSQFDSQKQPASNTTLTAKASKASSSSGSGYDFKLQKEMLQKAIGAIEKRSEETIRVMAQQASERESQRQKQLQRILKEEQDVKMQLASQRSLNKDRANEFQQQLQSQMQEYLTKFQAQMQETTARLASLRAEEREQLEEQKEAARLMHQRLEMQQRELESAHQSAKALAEDAAVHQHHLHQQKEMQLQQATEQVKKREAEQQQQQQQQKAQAEAEAERLRRKHLRNLEEERMAQITQGIHDMLQAVYADCIEQAIKQEEKERESQSQKSSAKFVRKASIQGAKDEVVRQNRGSIVQVLTFGDESSDHAKQPNWTVHLNSEDVPSRQPTLSGRQIEIESEVIDEETSSQQSITQLQYESSNPEQESQKIVYDEKIVPMVRKEIQDIFMEAIKSSEEDKLVQKQSKESKILPSESKNNKAGFKRKHVVTIKVAAQKVIQQNKVVTAFNTLQLPTASQQSNNTLQSRAKEIIDAQKKSAALPVIESISEENQENSSSSLKKKNDLSLGAEYQKLLQLNRPVPVSIQRLKSTPALINDTESRQLQIQKTQDSKALPEFTIQDPSVIQYKPTEQNIVSRNIDQIAIKKQFITQSSARNEQAIKIIRAKKFSQMSGKKPVQMTITKVKQSSSSPRKQFHSKSNKMIASRRSQTQKGASLEEQTMIPPETSHSTSRDGSPARIRRRSSSITSGQADLQKSGNKKTPKKRKVRITTQHRNCMQTLDAQSRSTHSIMRNHHGGFSYPDIESSFVENDGLPSFQEPHDIYGSSTITGADNMIISNTDITTQRALSLQRGSMQKSISSPAPQNIRSIDSVQQNSYATRKKSGGKKSKTRHINALDELIPPRQVQRYHSVKKSRDLSSSSGQLQIMHPTVKVHPQLNGLLNKYSHRDLIAQPYLQSVGELIEVTKRQNSSRQALQKKLQSQRDRRFNAKSNDSHLLIEQQHQSQQQLMTHRMIKDSPYAARIPRGIDNSAGKTSTRESNLLSKEDFYVDVQRREFPGIASINMLDLGANQVDSQVLEANRKLSRKIQQQIQQQSKKQQVLTTSSASNNNLKSHLIVPHQHQAQPQAELGSASQQDNKYLLRQRQYQNLSDIKDQWEN